MYKHYYFTYIYIYVQRAVHLTVANWQQAFQQMCTFLQRSFLNHLGKVQVVFFGSSWLAKSCRKFKRFRVARCHKWRSCRWRRRTGQTFQLCKELIYTLHRKSQLVRGILFSMCFDFFGFDRFLVYSCKHFGMAAGVQEYWMLVTRECFFQQMLS